MVGWISVRKQVVKKPMMKQNKFIIREHKEMFKK